MKFKSHRQKKLAHIRKWRENSKEAKRLGIKSLGTAAPWLVNAAKEFGLDIEGLEHEITDDFIRHVIKSHGKANSEEPQGQMAVTQDDFSDLSDVLRFPDRVLLGVKNKYGKNMIHYAKKMTNGTILYAENILDSNKNLSLRGQTMLKRRKNINDKILSHFASNNGKNDISNIKLVDPIDSGGSSSIPIPKPVAVANSAATDQAT
jgi:hypothetical protein